MTSGQTLKAPSGKSTTPRLLEAVPLGKSSATPSRSTCRALQLTTFTALAVRCQPFISGLICSQPKRSSACTGGNLNGENYIGWKPLPKEPWTSIHRDTFAAMIMGLLSAPSAASPSPSLPGSTWPTAATMSTVWQIKPLHPAGILFALLWIPAPVTLPCGSKGCRIGLGGFILCPWTTSS